MTERNSYILPLIKNNCNFYRHLLFLFFTCSIFSVKSQCIAAGPNSATVFVNDVSGGTVAWTNPNNGQTSNTIYAAASQALSILSSANTGYLKCSNFGFSLTNGVAICGIEVRVQRNSSGTGIGSSISDNGVYIVKNGSIAGTNHSSGTWPSSNTYITYGSSSDTWGTTWTAADINSSNFGVAVSAKLSAGLIGVSLSANVDHVSMTIYYDDTPLPIEIIEFKGESLNEKINLHWKTASEKENSYFEIEKKNNDTWTSFVQVKGSGNSSSEKEYSAYDENPQAVNYYRLKQVDHNGQFSYSNIIAITHSPKEFRMYPIPAGNILTLELMEGTEPFELYDGLLQKIEVPFEKGKLTKLDISGLPAGVYFIKIYSEGKDVVKKFVKQ